MLIVKPILEKDKQEEICQACGAVYDADLLACSAYDDENLVGFCQFALSGKTAILTDLRPKIGVDDFEAMFILARGTLNYIDLCGIHYARFDGDTAPAGEQMIHAIGFRQGENDVWEVDLTDFFTAPCQHDHGMPENH